MKRNIDDIKKQFRIDCAYDDGYFYYPTWVVYSKLPTNQWAILIDLIKMFVITGLDYYRFNSIHISSVDFKPKLPKRAMMKALNGLSKNKLVNLIKTFDGLVVGLSDNFFKKHDYMINKTIDSD